MRLHSVLLILFIFPAVTEARIFRLSQETFSGYFSGSIGLSQVEDAAYSDSSGAQTVFGDEPGLNYSGELGISFSSVFMHFTLGLEFIAPEKMDIEGSNSAGTKLMDLESNIRATVLKAGLFFPMMVTNSYRSYVGVTGGLASLKMENTYELTATGQGLYSLTNYSETAEATATTFGLIVGFEYNFADTSTVIIEGGYRYLPVDEWEYSKADTGFTGSYSKGDPVVNHDGSKRETDLSGLYLGIGFKLYID